MSVVQVEIGFLRETLGTVTIHGENSPCEYGGNKPAAVQRIVGAIAREREYQGWTTGQLLRRLPYHMHGYSWAKLLKDEQD